VPDAYKSSWSLVERVRIGLTKKSEAKFVEMVNGEDESELMI
jgi:hypothetical protein